MDKHQLKIKPLQLSKIAFIIINYNKNELKVIIEKSICDTFACYDSLLTEALVGFNKLPIAMFLFNR